MSRGPIIFRRLISGRTRYYGNEVPRMTSVVSAHRCYSICFVYPSSPALRASEQERSSSWIEEISLTLLVQKDEQRVEGSEGALA